MEEQPTPAILTRPVLLASLGLTFLIFTLPAYARALGASALEIGGLYSIFTVAVLLLRPAIGWGLDRFGRRAFLVAGLAGYALAMLLFAFSSSLSWLYLARLVNGVASALTWITTTTVVADLAGLPDRARSMGRITEMGSRGEILGAFIGYTLYNMLPEEAGWQASFLVFAGAAGFAALLTWRSVPETRPVTTMKEGPRPALSLSRPFLWLLAAVLITAFAQALISPIYLIYLQDKFQADIGTLAFAFLPGGIVFAVLPSHLGRLSDRLGRAPFISIGLVGAGLLFLALPALPNLLALVALYTLVSFGWAMAIPAEAALVADLTGQETRGQGYGLYQFTSSLGAAIGPLLGGWLYDHSGHATPFYLNGILLLAGAAWVYLGLRRVALPQPVQQTGQ